MSATVTSRIQLKRDTTEHWNQAIGFIPLPGEVIIYEDYETKTYIIEENGKTTTKTVNIPNIKIGTGNAYVQDLAFVDEKTRDMLMEHVINQDIHVTLGEKVFWNNKINVDDAEEIITGELEDETLILNRN
jgi:hypothetical protein